MTLNERVTKLEVKHITNKHSITNANLIMACLLLVVSLLTVGLITSTECQQRQISELKTELKKQSNEVEKLKNRNSAQDIILNKLNAEYQMKERQKAEEAKRIADANRVGG